MLFFHTLLYMTQKSPIAQLPVIPLLTQSPKSPDDECDMGVHHFRYALYPHDEDFRHCDALQQALSFNAPLHLLMSDKE